jgi:hypothetical protein
LVEQVEKPSKPSSSTVEKLATSIEVC